MAICSMLAKFDRVQVGGGALSTLIPIAITVYEKGQTCGSIILRRRSMPVM